MIKRRHAVALFANRADKLPSLIVAECRHRIADSGIAGRAGPLEELVGHGSTLIGFTARREENLVRIVQTINHRSLRAIELGLVVIAPGTKALG